MADWTTELEAAAPDVVAGWRAIGEGYRPMRRALSRATPVGSAPRILAQQEVVGDALEAVLRAMPEELLRAPGGEEDWNVAQAFAHTTAARRFLAAWAAQSLAGEWPADPARAPRVTPSVPGRADAGREELLVLLDKSRRSLRASAATIAGHERQPCPLDHPLVGRLRCGEWLLFVGVHDLMHLEQLHGLLGGEAGGRDAMAADG